MSAQDEVEKALKYVGIDAEVRLARITEHEKYYSIRLPDTYVFKEPEKAPSPQPDEPKIDIDKMRRIGSAPAMASGDAKGPDGSFNTGMTLRMWLAGQTMNGMLASGDLCESLAHVAFTFADDMILESLK